MNFYTLIKTNKFGNTLPSIGKTGFQPSAHTLTSQSTARNLWQVKQQIQDNVSQIEGRDNIHFMDGFPIPVCHYGRAYRHKNYQDLAAFSYCAAKQERYYGFEGHLLVNLSGMIKGFTFAPANVDERAVAPDITDSYPWAARR